MNELIEKQSLSVKPLLKVALSIFIFIQN